MKAALLEVDSHGLQDLRWGHYFHCCCFHVGGPVDAWVADGDRINELRRDIRHLQDQLADRDLALDWAVQSRLLVCAKEARAQARIKELSSTVDNLQVYCNTLHEEVYVLYSQLHPSVPAHPAEAEAGPSHVAGRALGGELDLFEPPPSLRLVDV